ncbi:MFS transporter [Polyangium mundeleinium]|uniref:MFS transporter n=1 Tax=Polyangium mundeleinium TaxID=2995306 RepID=A0ABT5EUB6_9BACT|nr:MFS transporter [Polyangium mundeleinium]MDC0745400.1 MFS transporter [Polyangium mundeleinium]
MAEQGPRVPMRLLVAIALSASLAPLNSTMVAVALPAMSRDLGAESSVLRQGLVTSYLLTNIVLQSPGGKLGDRLGYRRALAMGQILFALGATLAYVWPLLPGLTAARILMASGGAILAPSAFAMLRTELPPEVRGRAFGAMGAMMGLSAGLGPKVGALLVTHFGWTSIFLANVPVLLASAALVHLGAPAASPPKEAAARPRFDVLGSVLLGASLLGLVIGLENKELRWAAALGVLGLVPFAWWEQRAADPIIDFSLFKRRSFVAGSLLIAIQNFAMYSMLFELPQVAGRLFGAGPRDVGNTLVTMMAMMIVASPFAGRASERFGARAVALTGSALALVGMTLLVFLPFHAVTDAVPALGLLGLGLGLTSAPSQASSISDVPREKSGMAAGLTSTMRYLGGIAGLTVLGLVLTESPVPEIARREHATSIVIFCASLVVTLGCAALLPGRLPPPVPAAAPR